MPLTVFADTVAFVVPVASQMPTSLSSLILSMLATVFCEIVAPLTPCMYRPTSRIAFAPVLLRVFWVYVRLAPPCGVVPPVANTPTNARRMSLFWIVMFENRPALPSVVASEITTALLVFAPLMTMPFFSTPSVIGVAPTEPNRTTDGEVTLLFWRVRLRSVPAPPIEPSTVTRLAPLKRISAPLNEPEMTRAAPVGRIVIV